MRLTDNTHLRNPGHAAERKTVELADVGVALRAAAMEAGHLPALRETFAVLGRRAPDVWRSLGLED